MSDILPLQGGAVNAHQTISYQVGDTFIDVILDYRSLLEQWSMRIEIEGVAIVEGAMLEPNANVTQEWNLDIGKFVFIGDEPTLDNLGTSNQLTWTAND